MRQFVCNLISWHLNYHDNIFADINELHGGKKTLIDLAKKSGVNMTKSQKILRDKNEIIYARVQEDISAAAEFNFQGTPGFL